MNDLESLKSYIASLEQEKSGSDIESQWRKAQKDKTVLEAELTAVDKQIENEVKSLKGDQSAKEKNAYDTLPESTKELLKKQNELYTKHNFLFFLFWAILVAVPLFIFRTDIFTLIPLSGNWQYVAIGAAALIVSGIITSFRVSSINKKINKIRTVDAVRNYRAALDEIRIETTKKIKHVEKEKYAEHIHVLRQAINRIHFDEKRKQMIRHMHGNTIFFYFNKFASYTHYDIKVDGVSVLASNSQKFQTLRLNPGYHAIEIVAVYHYRSSDGITHRESSSQFQVGEQDLPMFLVCKKVNGYGSEIRKVSLEEFEKTSGKKLL